MKVVILSEFYCRGMGYLENMLPKYLARLGAETHVIATALHPRNGAPDDVYGGFLTEAHAGTTERLDGYALHRIGHKRRFGYTRMSGLKHVLRQIRPDVVQTMSVTGWIPVDAALLKPILKYKLFTGCHHHASVFALARKDAPRLSAARLTCALTRGLPGLFVSQNTEKCYAISSDCADIAVRFFGVSAGLVEVCPLGVDTEIFHPISTRQEELTRDYLRRQFDFAEHDIVSIYTGRFSDDKNPLLLARAVDRLVCSGERFRGLFVGNGPQLEDIRRCRGCIVHPFAPVSELGGFYRASELAVWPTQESMSMLDAAACGLPIVVNEGMAAIERVEGNGLTYRIGDLDDLVRVLKMLADPAMRRRMGKLGSERIGGRFSWETVAKNRLRDYAAAIGLGESNQRLLAKDSCLVPTRSSGSK